MKNKFIKLIKKLRKITNISIIECKNAILKSKGNIDIAIKNLRIKGILKNNYNINNLLNGLILIKKKNNIGVILEVNCQTDFVSKNSEFIKFCKKIINYIILNYKKNIKEIKNKFKKENNFLKNKFKEQINIKRFKIIKNKIIKYYLHNYKKGSIISAKKGNKKTIEKIAIHVVAFKTKYICNKEIPKKLIKNEKKIQNKINKKLNKPKNILKEIIKGKINKFKKKITLINQNYIFNPKYKIIDIIKKEKIKIKKIIYFELGN